MKADFTIFFLLVIAVAAFVGSDSLSTPVCIAAIPGLVLVQLYRETSGWERWRLWCHGPI